MMDPSRNKTALNNLISDGRIAIKCAVLDDKLDDDTKQKVDHWEEMIFWEIGRVDPDNERVAIRTLGERDCVAPLNPVNIEFREFEELKKDKDGNPIYKKDAASFDIALLTDDVHKIKSLPNHSSRIHRQQDGQAGELDNMIWVAAIPDSTAIIKKKLDPYTETSSASRVSLRTGAGRYLYDKDGAKTFLEKDERPEYRLMWRVDESPRDPEAMTISGMAVPGTIISADGGHGGDFPEAGWMIVPFPPKEDVFIRRDYKRPPARIAQIGDIICFPISDTYDSTIDGDSAVHADIRTDAHFFYSDDADGPIDFRRLDVTELEDIDSFTSGTFLKSYMAFDTERAGIFDDFAEGMWRPIVLFPYVSIDDDPESWEYGCDVIITDHVISCETDVADTPRNVFRIMDTGDANPKFCIDDSGNCYWGAGGGSAVDIGLGRGAANRLDLATGDSFNIISGGLMFAGVDTGLKNLDTVEIQQLENIGTSTISAAQWSYLGNLDQNLSTISGPTFISLALDGSFNLKGNFMYGTTYVISNAELNQLGNIGSTTISAGQWGYLGALNQALATSNTPTFAALSVTASPAQIFLDSSSGTSYSRINYKTDNAHEWYIGSRNDGAYDGEYVWESSNPSWTVKMALTTAGKLGIGVTTPSTLLHIRDAATTLPAISANTKFLIEDSDIVYLSLVAPTVGAILFGDAAVENAGSIFYSHVGEFMILGIGGAGKVKFNVDDASYEVPIKIKEAAAAVADTAGYGQAWVRTATPNEFWFTDDAGNDQLISGRTLTVTPANDGDAIDVTGITTIFVDTSAGNVVIGGTIGGVNGQELVIVVHDWTNNTTIEDIEGTGNQDFYLHAEADETLTAEPGGWHFKCEGGNHWHDASHAKHV